MELFDFVNFRSYLDVKFAVTSVKLHFHKSRKTELTSRRLLQSIRNKRNGSIRRRNHKALQSSVMQMLIDREYLVTESDINMTKEQYSGAHMERT